MRPARRAPSQGHVAVRLDKGSRALAAAQTQIGQAEQPPGSNDGPAIGMYRSAVEGSCNAGAPWCAYFVSWCAAQAGTPIGDRGQGLGSVAAITDWAGRTGRLVSQPQPGDLILFGTSHVGIVQSVNPTGRSPRSRATLRTRSRSSSTRRAKPPASYGCSRTRAQFAVKVTVTWLPAWPAPSTCVATAVYCVPPERSLLPVVIDQEKGEDAPE